MYINRFVAMESDKLVILEIVICYYVKMIVYFDFGEALLEKASLFGDGSWTVLLSMLLSD